MPAIWKPRSPEHQLVTEACEVLAFILELCRMPELKKPMRSSSRSTQPKSAENGSTAGGG